MYQKCKYYREEKQDFERFLIFLWQNQISWTQWEVYGYVERWRDPLGCHVPFASRQKWKRKMFKKNAT